MIRNFVGLAFAVFTISFIICVVDGQSNQTTGTWMPWVNASICSARSCNCSGSEETCPNGTRIQIRLCQPYQGTWCNKDADGVGAIRLKTCINSNETCPGWGEWGPYGKCNCDTKQKRRERFCNNPPPINIMDQCFGMDTGDNENTTDCNRECTTTPATTTQQMTEEPVTELPDCTTWIEDSATKICEDEDIQRRKNGEIEDCLLDVELSDFCSFDIDLGGTTLVPE